MARKIIHSETVSRASRAQVYRRVQELKVTHPEAVVTSRWNSRAGYFSITASVEGETKIQTRGHCQFCGNHQVVKDGLLVLHGYERPGHGWVYGRCPGVGEVPLQTADDLTRRYLAGAELFLSQAQDRLAGARAELKVAEALYSKSGESAYTAPAQPYKPTPERTAKYEADLAAWREANPVAARFVAARHNESDQRRNVSIGEGQVAHFNTLLGWNLVGTPLLEVAK
jgi:hypothetical protein